MTIKDLSQLPYLKREIERNTFRLAQLQDESTNAAQTITGMPHAPGVSDKVGKYATEIANLSNTISDNLQKCLILQNQLEKYISEISDSQMRQIVILRFAYGLEWRQVAWRLGGNNTADSVRKACTRFVLKQNRHL